MSRVQLALNVPDIDAAVDFYAKLFATGPSKRKTGYANFVIDKSSVEELSSDEASPEFDARLNAAVQECL